MADKKQKLNAMQELRTLDAKGLQAKVIELKTQLAEQQRSHAAQELPSAAIIGKTRKQIAQTLTVLKESQLKENLAEPTAEAQKEEDK